MWVRYIGTVTEKQGIPGGGPAGGRAVICPLPSHLLLENLGPEPACSIAWALAILRKSF